ncbi:hypothetical protein DYB35_008738, partial [Aphanomyces astaci]
MNRVGPFDSASSPTPDPSFLDRHAGSSAYFGFVYLVATIGLSMWYLTILEPYMGNDLFWPQFNSTGTQTFVIDAFHLETNYVDSTTADHQPTAFSILDMAIQRDYSGSDTVVALKATYPRRMISEQLTSIESAIQGIHTATSVASVLKLNTAYCWLDFDRLWPVAHTQGRLERCRDRYADNAAVYMESMLRIVPWNEWMAQSGSDFTASIATYLGQSDLGIRWLKSVPNAFVSVEVEAAYWRQKHMTTYRLQWGNLFMTGLDESIAIRNALGMVQYVLTYQVKPVFRQQVWTSVYMNWGIWNDMTGIVFTQLDHANVSLVRNSTDDFDLVVVYDTFASPSSGTVVSLLRSELGPTNSIDMYVVPRPPSALLLLKSFQTMWTVLIEHHDPTLFAMFNAIPDTELDPVPPSWLDPLRVFYGGNPMCVFNTPTSYVQAPFGFDDTCTSAVRHTVSASKWHVLFATMAVNLTIKSRQDDFNRTSVCDLCPTTSHTCLNVVHQAHTVYEQWQSTLSQIPLDLHERFRLARDAFVAASNVSLIQFADDQGFVDGIYFDQSNLLVQPLVMTDDVAWNFLGWLHMYDWMTGTREVVSFEGNLQSLALLSTAYVDHVYVPSNLEVPQRACKYVWYISVYVTFVLGGVAVILVMYAMGVATPGRPLLHFNRVVGCTWIGRPFLLVRGVAAIVMLSTSPVVLSTSMDGVAYLQGMPRSWVQTLVVAGEATWVAYVIQDVLLIVTDSYAKVYCPVATAITWVIYVVVDIATPVVAISTEIDRHCAFVNMDTHIACSSGVVEIGSSTRAQWLVAIALGSTLISLLLTWLAQLRYLPVIRSTVQSPMIFPGASAAFLPGTHGLPLESFDRIVCVMSGLLPFTFQNKQYVLDLKLWVVVPSSVLNYHLTSIPSAKTHFHQFIHVATKVIESRPEATEHCESNKLQQQHPPPQDQPHPVATTWKFVVLAGAGFVYMVGTSAASVSYLAVTQVNMANDFWWPNFNSSGTHLYLANWFNHHQLMHTTNVTAPAVASTLAKLEFASLDKYNDSNSPIQFTSFAATHAMYDMRMSLHAIVIGIRSMDGCKVPWISTQYCWVDFQQRWAMARSEARQLRCDTAYAANGAVYFESMARNLNWNQFNRCWGDAFDVAIRYDLNASDAGLDWLPASVDSTRGSSTSSTSSSSRTSVSDEVGYWSREGIRHFTMQWQNFKSVGVAEYFQVVNAFGVAYDLTLKDTKSSFHLDTQTSRKLSWGLVGDFDAVTRYGLALGKSSLVRGSANYLYDGDQVPSPLEALMIANGTLVDFSVPVTNVFPVQVPSTALLLRQLIGPYGTIDAWHVPVPTSLQQFTASVTEFIVATLASKPAQVQTMWTTLPIVQVLRPTPPGLVDWNLVGGNLLCDYKWPRVAMFSFYGVSSACSSILAEHIDATAMSIVYSLVGVNAMYNDHVNLTAISQLAGDDDQAAADVLTMLTTAKRYVETNLSCDMTWTALQEQAQRVQAEVADMAIEIAQFAVPDETITSDTGYGIRPVVDIDIPPIIPPPIIPPPIIPPPININVSEEVVLITATQRRLEQGGGDPPPAQLYHMNVFDTNQAAFHLFAWSFMYEWVLGVREVVTFQ